ncbi:hypothetical protein ABIC71_000521 [Herbaspirillum seropedicae]|jgi:hypothetical protein|uniref:hypothetical protein n=1 Tax=Herbaspirillum seropedicae TaxID=964 RepID=UPI0028664D34|nr:hypothetical protein [Herbaspirillum seropedicae]MDR6394358.1 hypothetical protein [Herbaspirillum seropedicae]
MTIPIDIPGGDKLDEMTAPLMQPGVQQAEGGGFRGIVLIGASHEDEMSTYVCEPVREASDAAYADALAYIAQQGPAQG